MSDDLVKRLRVLSAFAPESVPVLKEAADEIERLLEEQQKATLYAESLAVALSRHFPHVPQWRPFTGDLIGLLTQIDNMTTGLLPAHEVERLRTENERLRAALRYYAENHYPNVNDGPWGVNSTDFGDVARAALTDKGEKP